MNYQDINANTIDRWTEEGWEWGIPISHEQYIDAKNGKWEVKLTPTKNVPHKWIGELRGKKVLGLASGGGQQMPVFAALGAQCTVLDYSQKQIDTERMVAEREGYSIRVIRGDMTKPLPFTDGEFDLIFHPVSNCYVEDVRSIWKECYRILKYGGLLISGTDHYINYIVDKDEKEIINSLPFNPLKDPQQMRQLQEDDAGVQFSHSLEEQIGGQIEAGFTLLDMYEDTNGEGRLHELNIPTFLAMRSIKGSRDALNTITDRHSYRGKYKPDRVPREDLCTIMKAGLAAPSGCNRQTTSLIAVDDPEQLQKLYKVINPPVCDTAPAMICVLTQRITAYCDRCFAVQDYSAAIENMLLAITAMGYQSCWYEGHITDEDRIGFQMAKILNVPDEYELVCMLPVGLSETVAKAPKKKSFEERAWFNSFSNVQEADTDDAYKTERLLLRRWGDNDAEDLYKYASDPDVGPIAGWPPHQSIDESLSVIRNVLNGKEAYAICLKEDGKAIGAIELKLNGHTDMTDRDEECELGYWLGKPYWGQGIMPEAVKEMLRHAFEDCGMQKVWIGYYEGNRKSKRVQEKCGFKYQWRSENVDVPLMHEKRTGHVSLMTKEDWETMK